MRPKSQRVLEAECNRFNAAHLVGQPIRIWPGGRVGPGKIVGIAAPGAYVLSGHTAVVQVTGGHGCVALSHVEEV